MRKPAVILLIVLLLALALLLVVPNLKSCSSSDSSDLSGLLNGEPDDGLCDVCGAPATMKKRGYEVCGDCYDQALDYYNSHY